MKIEDRLKKAERKLKKHLSICKDCNNNRICTIVIKFQNDVDKIKREMRSK